MSALYRYPASFFSPPTVWPIEKYTGGEKVGELVDVLNRIGLISRMALLFKAFVEKRGISDDSYLDLNGREIRDISYKDMKYPVMWGINSGKRLSIFLGIKNEKRSFKTEGEDELEFKGKSVESYSLLAISQRDSDTGDNIALFGTIAKGVMKQHLFCQLERLLAGNIISCFTVDLKKGISGLNYRINISNSISSVTEEETLILQKKEKEREQEMSSLVAADKSI